MQNGTFFHQSYLEYGFNMPKKILCIRYVSSEPSLSTVEEENNRWRNIHITEEWNEYT